MNSAKATACSTPGITVFSIIKDYVQMLKLHLCIYIVLSAISGYVLATDSFSLDALWAGGMVLMLAQGSAVLNNIQDRRYDLGFHRTFNRALPQKRVPLIHAAVISTALITTGLAGLLYLFSWPCLAAGVLAVIMYNGLYTPLKKRTLAAIIPGTISGMMPVLIGWTAAGSSTPIVQLVVLMLVLGLWQIPHFFIITLNQSQYRRKRAEQNRYPCFARYLGETGLRLQILIWTCFYSFGIFLFLIIGGIGNGWFLIVSAVNAFMILAPVISLHQVPRRFPVGLAFAFINISMLIFLGAQILDKILN